MYNSNRNYVNICYGTLHVTSYGQNHRLKKKNPMKIWQDVLLIGIPLKQLFRFPDLRSFSHKNYFWNTKNCLTENISQISKRHFKVLC